MAENMMENGAPVMPMMPPQNAIPEAAPAMPGVAPQEGFDPEAAMQELQAGAEGLKAKEAELATKQVVNENELQAMKEKIIGDLFEMMKTSGVDPSDQNSVSDFLNMLKEQDPDLYELFDFAFNNLIGEQPTMTPPEMSGNFTPQEGAGDVPPSAGAVKGPQDLTGLTAALG